MLHTIPRLNFIINENCRIYAGERRFFACSGLVIEWNGCTIILTSASLVRDPNDENKIAEKLKVGSR
jgi:hypothetical protein